MPKILLAILTAGRKECLDLTIESLNKNLSGSISEKIIFNNSIDLDISYKGYKTRKTRKNNLPYGQIRHSRALSFMFKHIKKLDIDYVIFFEEDWELLTPVFVDDLCNKLDDSLSQIRLSRPNVYDYPEITEISEFIRMDHNDVIYKFSWNPCVFSKDLVDNVYPNCVDHELRFGDKLSKDFLVYSYPNELVRHSGKISLSSPGLTWNDDYSNQTTKICKNFQIRENLNIS
jgi:hypothetical protein